MAMKFAATTKAVQGGFEGVSPAKGADLIEDWEAALADVEVPGAKGILRDLAALRRQVEAAEPNQERVSNLLHRLGAATVKIADRATSNQEKLRDLGQALMAGGTGEAEEDEAA